MPSASEHEDSASPAALGAPFAGDTKGVSAVEFALVLPLMLTLYLGGAELAQAISASRKVTLVSRTVADLAAQSLQPSATQR